MCVPPGLTNPHLPSPPADELDALPPRLSRSNSHSLAKRRLFSPRLGCWHVSHGQRLGFASVATTLLLLLTLTAFTSRLEAMERSRGGSAAPQPGRQLPRLLLPGGSRRAPHAGAPQQPAQQLWNVSLLLTVSGGGIRHAQLAGRLQEPFLQALMVAAATAGARASRQRSRVGDGNALH